MINSLSFSNVSAPDQVSCFAVIVILLLILFFDKGLSGLGIVLHQPTDLPQLGHITEIKSQRSPAVSYLTSSKKSAAVDDHIHKVEQRGAEFCTPCTLCYQKSASKSKRTTLRKRGCA